MEKKTKFMDLRGLSGAGVGPFPVMADTGRLVAIDVFAECEHDGHELGPVSLGVVYSCWGNLFDSRQMEFSHDRINGGKTWATVDEAIDDLKRAAGYYAPGDPFFPGAVPREVFATARAIRRRDDERVSVSA